MVLTIWVTMPSTIETTMVRENEDNPKALWNSIKKVLHRSPKMVLPDYTTMNSQHFWQIFCRQNC